MSDKANQGKFWWTYKKDETYVGVFETVEHLKYKQAHRSEDNLRNLRLYGNSEVLGLRWGDCTTVKNLNKLTLNVVQSAVDTATARIAKTKPKAMFLTEDGDFTMQRKAKNLEQYVAGCFYNMDLYEKGQAIFRDAGVFGDGLIKFYQEDGKIKCERAFPEEILVDEDECIYGEDSQRTMHQIKYVSKNVLLAKYPNKAMSINSAKSGSEDFMKDQLTPDLVMVIESWKIPDGPKDKGRHSISVSTTNLIVEDWDKSYFPFEKWGWNPRLIGYWSQGISEQLTGIQIEMNKLLKNIQICLHLGAVPKIYINELSKITSNHINNQIGGIVKYRGEMPKEGQLMRVPPELFQMLNYLYEKSFQTIGLSAMSAQSEKPTGLDSGKALRTFHDIESERFAVTAQRWENFYMKCSKKIIKMSKDMAKDNPKMQVQTIDSKRMKVIKWNDVDMEDDAYVLKIYPTNLLADDPSGKLQDVGELMNLGLLDARSASSLLDFPDVESVLSAKNAIVQDIDATVEDIIENGLYNPPEPFQDLEYAIPRMNSEYLKFKRSNLDIEKLELFTRWIEDAMILISPPAAQLEEEIDPELEQELLEAETVDPEQIIDAGVEEEMINAEEGLV